MIGPYLEPPERAVMLYVDDESQIRTLNGTSESSPFPGPRRSSAATTIKAHRQPLHCVGPATGEVQGSSQAR